jgi:hypothetical protein
MSAAPLPGSTPSEEPKSLLDKAGAALPIALTALATAFAGMSTSELQQAMFWRSAAAQDQAKATNQWTLAGFKRDRSLLVQTTAAMLRAQSGWVTPDVRTMPVNGFNNTTGGELPEPNRTAFDWLNGKGPPLAKLPEVEDETLKLLLKAIQEREPEAELLRRASRVNQATINAAIDDAEKSVERTDMEWDPTLKEATRIVQDASRHAGGTPANEQDRAAIAAHATRLQAAGFELENRRYRAEATLNQGVGFLYEARVKVSTAVSDRHRERSKNFFYAMLAAQLGAVIASLGLARNQRSLLWLLAGLAGVVAVGFGAYVYVGM